MKNLFAIPRLSLSETFTILITLVVCLVGFTNAEVYPNVRKRDPNLRENENFLLQKASFRESVPQFHESSKISKESEEKKFSDLRNFPEYPLDKLFERHSDYFGESEESDGEKETDGYGYDDDEYYHFNFKRNDETNKVGENSKTEKDSTAESQGKDAIKNDKYFRESHKEGEKDDETIELLNFKESHLTPVGDKAQNTKTFPEELQKKQRSGEPGSSLKMSDIKENSAIDEKLKDGKEPGGGLANDQKSIQNKNGLKSDDKDAGRLKDMKLTEDSEKKEKEPNLKDLKEGVSSNSVKETSKASDEDKTLKLNGNAKFQESIGKCKESSKATKDEGEISKYREKVAADGLADMSSRANFASNDYKENTDAIKNAGADEEEKNSYEVGGLDKKTSLSNYQDAKQSRDRVRKQYTVRENHANVILKPLNRQDDPEGNLKDASKTGSFLRSQMYETANTNPKELFKNSQFWKEVGLKDGKSRQYEQQTVQQNMSEESQQLSDVPAMPQVQSEKEKNPNLYDKGGKNPYGFNTEQVDSGSTDFYKNYLKSLKRYKSLNEDTKALPSDSSDSGTSAEEKIGYESAGSHSNEAHEAKNRRSMPVNGITEGKEKAQIRYSNSKRDTQSNHYKQCKVHARSSYEQSPSTKTSKHGSRLSDVDNREKQQESGRLRRKSPQKLEYEIKVINQNKEDARGMDQLSHFALKRVEKDLKTKLATDDKYLKKYPYSQVSRDDLTRLSKVKESENYELNKRTARTAKRQDDKSNVLTRGVPSGYYGNRVKFGQKSYTRNNEKINSDHSRLEPTNNVEKNQQQDPSEIKDEDFKHDPMKRFDENGYLNKGNSLLLVKKGERTAKTFEEGNISPKCESDFTSDAIAKILARDNDFLVLKRTQSNKFQKFPETENAAGGRMESGGIQLAQESSFGEGPEDLKNDVKEAMLKKELHARSYHPEKLDKKYTSSASSKSNLKKTFEKFRDLAGFFKDSEQESPDNAVREVKEGRDIVFSEDKLPDPIIISSDPGDKYSGLKPKPQNSIYSISTNFKALDQQDKKKEVEGNNNNNNNVFSSQMKPENSQFSWEPALKNMFPEAKSVNSTIRNGNEIIVLDLNRNQLRKDHGFRNLIKQPSKQLYAPFGTTAQLPSTNTYQFPNNTVMPLGNSQLFIPTRGRVQIILDDGVSFDRELLSNNQQKDKNTNRDKTGSKASEDRAFAVITSEDNHPQIILPSDPNIISNLIRNIFDRKDPLKVITKKSADGSSGNTMSENFNRVLQDLSELSALNERENRKQGLADRRSSENGGPSSKHLEQLSRDSESTIRYLGNLLENIIAKSDLRPKIGKEQVYQGSLQRPEGSSGVNLENGQDGSVRYRWSDEGKGPDSSSVAQDTAEYAPGEDDEDTAALQSKGWVPEKEKNSEDELWEELALASDRIHRMRREGKGKQKRKALEPALSFEEIQSALSDSKSEGGLSRSDFNVMDSKQSEENKNEEASKDDSDMKSGYENPLNEFSEAFNENRYQKEGSMVPNESKWSRKKRKDTRRRKRSTRSDVKNKVSTTAVQNTILKTLAEDNYHSVYSPGIKRRLLSTKMEAEDADSYIDAKVHDESVIAEEPQAKRVKNSSNVDPMIIEIFKDVEEEGKNRARRSLTSDFHSDFKREIDLDESMPNDFQNFLVTSLGAFGSQKREVVKKDEALGEGKETLPENYNQGVESGKEVREDFALEKREVPSEDDRKHSNYKKHFGSESHSPGSNVAQLKKAEKATVGTEDKSKTEVAEEKFPTHIRIQVTNGSLKEKKSSKTIMEESETTSSEIENFPKEKELSGKSKVNSIQKSHLARLRQLPQSKIHYNNFDENGGQDNAAVQASYWPYRRRFNKKKFVMDSSFSPGNDYTKLDAKGMETESRRMVAEPNLVAEQTTQKNPVSHHLPQVDTVYTPTQGTNKAQLGSNKFVKSNSFTGKNPVAVKGGLESADRSTYEDGISGSLLKEKTEKVKSDGIKDFEDWKPFTSKQLLRQKLVYDAESQNRGTPYASNSYANPYVYSYKPNNYWQRRNLKVANGYVFHPYPKENISPNNLYTALKMKQEMKNQENQVLKNFAKTYHDPNKFYRQEAGQPVLTNTPGRSGSIISYDLSSNKKPVTQALSWEYMNNGVQTRGQVNPKSKTLHAKKEEKYALLDPLQGITSNGPKEQEYLDILEDDYADYPMKELQIGEELTAGIMKKSSKLFDAPTYNQNGFGTKISDGDDGTNEDDEEFDEDYEENGEDDDFYDYSQLAGSKAMNPYGDVRFQSSIHASPASTFGYLSVKDKLPEAESLDIEHARLHNPKGNHKLNSVAQLMDIVNNGETASSNLLRKVNEHSNIFGKNLLQNLYGHGYDEPTNSDKLQQHEVDKNAHLKQASKLSKRKLNSQMKVKGPLIDDRDFYEAKIEEDDLNGMNPPSSLGRFKTVGRSNYRLTKGHFLDAEFAGPGNDFENESEEKGKYLNDINFAKNGCSERTLNVRDTEEGDKIQDVKENLEDDGETISEDNVLENVIGKYIMRKTVKASPDQASKRSANKEKSHENESVRHELRKRSLMDSERVPKARVLRRRLSSGHLTENNFRKYHKKNFTGKRHVLDPNFSAEQDGVAKKGKKRENNIQEKRSALDLLKKLTNKDKDKKADADVDSKSAGFEPLSPLTDKKYQGSPGDVNQERKIEEGGRGQEKSALTESKWTILTTGFRSKDPLIDKKKSKISLKDSSSSRVQGPWKVELNDRCDAPVSYHSYKSFRKSYKSADLSESPPEEESKGLKAFLVIGRNPKAAKRNSEEALPAISGLLLKEVRNSYRPNSEEGRGISKKYVRKRYLKSSVDRMRKDFEEGDRTSGDRNANESEETVGALPQAEGLARDSRQPPRGLQINPKRSFASADDGSKSSRYLSKERLVKRKSALSSSNEAKIMRDSRHVKDETSGYLGQQVVNAILSHVSTNPKFKESVAPGLAPKPTTYKHESNDGDGALQQVDLSEQMQHFLHRFMSDLEKLAERRVRKRMCNQIDKEAKDFLEFLLAASPENGRAKNVKDSSFPFALTSPDLTDGDAEVPLYGKSPPERTTKAPTSDCPTECTTKPTSADYLSECVDHKKSENYQTDFQREIDELRKKSCLLLKLIVDYQKLSKLEKEILDVKYHSIAQQLDQLNEDLKMSKSNQEEKKDSQPPEEVSSAGYNVENNEHPGNSSQSHESKSCFRTSNANKKPKQGQKKKISKLFFEEMKNPEALELSTTTTIPVFENVSVGKLSELRNASKGKSDSELDVAPSTPLIPKTFELLLLNNSEAFPGKKKLPPPPPKKKTTTSSTTTTSTTTTTPSTTTTDPISYNRLVRKSVSCLQPAVATNSSRCMIMNTISTKYSGSNNLVSQQGEKRKLRKYAPHFPGRRKKRWKWKTDNEFSKFENPTKSSDGDFEEEYREWSSMPAIRRILNNLESGFEFDDLFKKRKNKKPRRRREKPD